MPRLKAMAWVVMFVAPSTKAAATTTHFNDTEITPVAHPINTQGQASIPCLCQTSLGTLVFIYYDALPKGKQRDFIKAVAGSAVVTMPLSDVRF
jgi:hypothetical protein